MNPLKYKSPLGYPGGKTRMAPLLEKHFPDISVFSGVKNYHEPFLGGGSVALYVHHVYPHLNVFVNDLYTNLYIFWTQLQSHGEELQEALWTLKDLFSEEEHARELFTYSKALLKEPDVPDFDKAVAFYIVNRVSFSGLTEAGSFTALRASNNWTKTSINKLNAYQTLIEDWTFSNESYEHLSVDREDTFIYYDPPYEIASSNLYGGTKGDLHRVFDHEIFFEEVNKLKSKIMISYNADDCIRERFKDWRQVEFDFTYVMRSNSDKYMEDQESRKEIILMNY